MASTFVPLLTYANNATPWHLGHHGDFAFKAVADNVYIMHGINWGKDKDAHCFIHNPAFIESKHGIILIDPGASYYVGKSVLEQIERISKKPIIAIFNTHHHSDHWFGNGAIVERYPDVRIYADKHLITSAQKQYFSTKKQQQNQYKAKIISYPNNFVQNHQSVTIDGEIFTIMHPNKAHTTSDILIAHKNSNIIFMGDVALESTLGYFDTYSSILGNIDILQEIASKPSYTLYVPGHGLSGDKKQVIEPYLNYLQIIKEEVSAAYRDNVSMFNLQETKKKILQRFSWEEEFNFPLRYVQSHMEFVYQELENSF